MGSFYVVSVIHLLDLCFIIIKYSRRLSPKHIKNINPPYVPFWKLRHYTLTPWKLVATVPPALNLIVLHLHIFELFALHLFWGGVGVDTHVTVRGQFGGQQFPPATFQIPGWNSAHQAWQQTPFVTKTSQQHIITRFKISTLFKSVPGFLPEPLNKMLGIFEH